MIAGRVQLGDERRADRRWAGTGAGAAALLATWAFAAATPAVATPDRDEARRALRAARDALGLDPAARAATGDSDRADAGRAARGATVALRDLARAIPALEGALRREARAILARPTDNPDPQGTTWTASPAAQSPHCSAHFCVHWVDAGAHAPSLADVNGSGDGDGVPDYVEQTVAVAEHSYAAQVGLLGWPAPVPDGFGAPSPHQAKTDVYLAQIGDRGLFGYAAPDPRPRQSCKRSCFAFLVLDNDYSPAEFGYPDPAIPLAVTLAHEFNHVLQFGIDTFQDTWLFEATAVWAEEKTFPDANDYLFYLPSFARTPGTPITKPDGGGGNRIYAAAVWNHWLDAAGGGYGPGVVLDTWLSSTLTRPPDYAVGAFDRAIRRAGGRGFAREFLDFAATSAEWRSSALPDAAAYPDVRRQGRLRPGTRRRFRLDHTALRMFRVRAAGNRAIRLRVKARRGVRSGIALIGRRGDPVGGAVTVSSRFMERGGAASIRLRRPGRFDRLTAAVVNADGRVRGFAGFDWEYRHDDREFRVRLTRHPHRGPAR